jgi:hypothetical protein
MTPPFRTFMGKPSTIPASMLFLYSMLSFADLALTWLLVHQSGGVFYESNPVAGAWLSRFGWPGLVAFKLGAFILLVSSVIFVARHRPAGARLVMLLACLVVGGVAGYSYVLLFRTF